MMKNNKKSYNKYERGKNTKKESSKSFYILKEIEKITKNVNHEMKILEFSHFDKKILSIYYDVIEFINNLENNYSEFEDILYVTYNELEKIISLYLLDIDESINKKKRIYNYRKICDLYNIKDNNDRIFNKQLNEYIRNTGSGIIPKLVKHILDDGNKTTNF